MPPPPSKLGTLAVTIIDNTDWEPQDATFPMLFQSRLHFKPSPPVKSLYQSGLYEGLHTRR